MSHQPFAAGKTPDLGLPPEITLCERCWGVLDVLQLDPAASLPDLLWTHDVTLDDVRTHETSWRAAAAYDGPALLPA